MQTPHTSNTSFHAIYNEWSTPKLVAALAYVLTETLGNGLLLGIILYERKSGRRVPLIKRTTINRLTSNFCAMLILMNLTLTNAVALIHGMGPAGTHVCSAIVFSSNFFLTLGLLLLDIIICLRYLYIFWWKTVGGMETDDASFALRSTISAMFVAAALSVMLRILDLDRNINYYFCIGKSPPDSWNKRHVPDIFCVLPSLSYFIHIFIFARIYFFNKRSFEPENQNLSTLCTSVLGMGLVFASSIPTLLVMSYFDPWDLNNTSLGRSCLFFSHFGIQFVTSIPFPLMYYQRNEGLKKALLFAVGGGGSKSKADNRFICPRKEENNDNSREEEEERQ